jgi:uncharacterized protein (DUF58 family)
MGQLALGLLLVVAGSFAQVPAIVLLGLVLALVEAVRQVWVARGLAGVRYTRRLPHPRGVVGDEIPLDLTVWNRKALPLGWLRVDDEATDGVVVRERPLIPFDDEPDRLRNAWTLAPFERVTRHLHIAAERRGVYALGPAHLEVGDLFARPAARSTVAGRDGWLVRPRTVPVTTGERANPWGGELRARHGLVEDRTRYAGVRPYQPGDAIRSVHWRATARLGEPVVRRYEPGRHREIVVALDVQTDPDALSAATRDDDLVEDLCVAAASLVRRLLDDGAAVGLAAAAWSGSSRALAWLAPASSGTQLGRCLDLLARLSPLPSGPFERLVTSLVRTLAPATPILVVTGREPTRYLPSLRRAVAAGYPVELVALGGAAGNAAAIARAAGLPARVGELDGTWRTATALRVSA